MVLINFPRKRIQFEDDVVVVFDNKNQEVYRGLEDYEPNKRGDWVWDQSIQGYKLFSNDKFAGWVKYCLDI